MKQIERNLRYLLYYASFKYSSELFSLQNNLMLTIINLMFWLTILLHPECKKWILYLKEEYLKSENNRTEESIGSLCLLKAV